MTSLTFLIPTSSSAGRRSRPRATRLRASTWWSGCAVSPAERLSFRINGNRHPAIQQLLMQLSLVSGQMASHHRSPICVSRSGPNHGAVVSFNYQDVQTRDAQSAGAE